MAIIQGVCVAGKVAFFGGVIVPSVDTLKIALYVSTATLGSSTAVYTTDNEVSGVGYTAGGNTLSNAAIGSSGSVAWLTFDNTLWPAATITARGALIYDSSKSDVAIAVLDFGADKTVTNDTFTVTFPVATATTALIRFN
jgi:hypothetical protein